MSEIKLRKYKIDDFEQWNEFIELSDNGTIFHRQDFLNYHGTKYNDNASHLVFTKGDKLITVMPLGFFEEQGQKVAKSPFGASYGGMVFQSDLSYKSAESINSLFLEYLKDNQIDKLRIIHAPSIYKNVQLDYMDFLLMKSGAIYDNADLSSYVVIDELSEDHYEYHAKKNLKKAIGEGLIVCEDCSHTEQFYEILIINRQKFGVLPTHTQKEIEWLLDQFKEQIKIFFVFQDQQVIAGALTILCNQNVLSTFYWAHLEEYQHCRPINFLVSHLIQYARKLKVKYLDFGPHTLNQEPFYGNTMFKESMGGRGILRNSFTLNFGGS